MKSSTYGLTITSSELIVLRQALIRERDRATDNLLYYKSKARQDKENETTYEGLILVSNRERTLCNGLLDRLNEIKRLEEEENNSQQN